MLRYVRRKTIISPHKKLGKRDDIILADLNSKLPFQLETQLECQIANDPAWQLGIKWGKPRQGHPEGQVLWHISDVLRNIDTYRYKCPDRRKLRLLALTHDTFKYQKYTVPVPTHGTQHSHGYFARHFARKYINDIGFLNVLEFHDDAYKAYRHWQETGNIEAGEKKAQILIEKLGENLSLYLCFYLCDAKTLGKTIEHYVWFCSLAQIVLERGGEKCVAYPDPCCW